MEFGCPRCGGLFLVPGGELEPVDRRGESGEFAMLVEAREETRRALAQLQESEVRVEKQALELSQKEAELAALRREANASQPSPEARELEASVERLKRELSGLRDQEGRVRELEEQKRGLEEELRVLGGRVRLLEASAETGVQQREDDWTVSGELPDPEDRPGVAVFWYAVCLLLGSGLGMVFLVLLVRVSPEAMGWVAGPGRLAGGGVNQREGGGRGRSSGGPESPLRIEGLWAAVGPEVGGAKRFQEAPKLPTGFMGVSFGAPASGLTKGGERSGEKGGDREKSGWKESGGRLHREVEFAGRKNVHAVAVPDSEGRLVMGAYLKVASKQGGELREFLEWAVSVNEDLVTRFGRPSEVHQVAGVSDSEEALEKISEGNDYYQATWEREGQDTRLVLSIRELNPHNVIFRLDYVSRSLTKVLGSGE
jgi:hypothetical protein